MKIAYLILSVIMILASCKKAKEPSIEKVNADIQKDLLVNSGKVTITNGVWGTVSKKEGNCMPMIDVKNTSCTEYTIKREVRIYSYTPFSNAVPFNSSTVFFTSFNSQLIKSVITDEKGFFEANLPNGKYTIVMIEDGKLYANRFSGEGGISPVEVLNNKVMANLVLDYAAY